MATPRAFAALRIPLKRGRLLTESDAPGRPLVAVINETAARLYWPGDDPVGRTIRYYPQETSPSIRIVGIVGDVRSMGPDNVPPPAAYVPFEQAPRPGYEGRSLTFVVRARGNPNDLASRRARRSRQSTRRCRSPTTADVHRRRRRHRQPRFTTVVMSVFAAIAFSLSALGPYGTPHAVEQRVREIESVSRWARTIADLPALDRQRYGDGGGRHGHRRAGGTRVDTADARPSVRRCDDGSTDLRRRRVDVGRGGAGGELSTGAPRDSRRSVDGVARGLAREARRAPDVLRLPQVTPVVRRPHTQTRPDADAEHAEEGVRELRAVDVDVSHRANARAHPIVFLAERSHDFVARLVRAGMILPGARNRRVTGGSIVRTVVEEAGVDGRSGGQPFARGLDGLAIA
jgi:hypothetical protein